MVRGNDLNDKHDKWNFRGLNIVWVETILDGIFRIGAIRVLIILGGIFTGRNCPGGSYPGWEFS